MSRPRSTADGRSSLKPITGTFTVPAARKEKIPASHAFDAAWDNALAKAAKDWGVAGNRTVVSVQYKARIDIWNPGGIGWCSVTLLPGG